MMEVAFAILMSLVQLGVFVGLIVFVVKLVTKKGASSTEGSGVSIRRFFQYLIMLVMLAIAAFGVIGIIDAVASAGSAVTRDTSAIARSIAFVVVGIPVYGGLALYTRRQLVREPREARSFGWLGYLTIALVGSLIFVMSFTVAFVGELLAEGNVDRTALVSMIVWGGVWFGHWWVAGQRAEESRMQFHLLAGSAVGLVPLGIGAGVAIGAALGEIYDAVFSVTAVDAGVETLVRGLVLFVIGALAWLFYWIGHARKTDRSVPWLIYVLLFGVLGGVITFVVGTGTLVYGFLDWFIGDVGSTSAASHFAFVPGAVAALVVGAGSWGYHRVVLGSRAGEARTEVHRVYDYLLSGAGLIVAASGLGTLITVALDAIGNATTVGSRGSTSAAGIMLLIIGVPLWWRHWSTVRHFRASEPGEEVASVTRRIYLFVLFGATSLVAVISLIVLIFIAVEDLLEATVGAATISSIAVPVALIVTSGAVAWYHFAVFREDRSITPKEVVAVLREVIVVGSDADIATVASGTKAHVQALRTAGEPMDVETLDDVIATLGVTAHERVVVVSEEGRFTVTPIEG
ncbi:MAG: DUF5671 domain-containing protein [Actinomycetota bacterium]